MVTQIPKMVKPGYQNTEVGIIPEDWKVEPLGQHSTLYVPMRNRPKKFGGKTPWLRIEDLDGKFVSDTKSDLYVTPETVREMKLRVYPVGTVLCSCSATIGVCAITEKELITNQTFIGIHPNSEIDKEFLYYYFLTQTNNLIKIGSGSTILYISREKFSELPIIIPPTPEQKKIVEALSDMDKLINQLEKIILKKKNIKQGAMQELLTGKKRLHGFRDKWEVKIFSQIFQFLNTANNPWADLLEFGDVAYIHYGDIHTNASAFLDCAKADLPRIAYMKIKNIPFVKDGDLVMADASEDYSGIGKCVEIRNTYGRKIVAGLHTFLLRADKEQLVDGFKGYLQFIQSVKASLIRRTTGISVYGISKNNVKSIEVLLPHIKEQSAIAQVLSDMDTEIEELEKERNKYIMIKKVLMQQLLTGSIRLR